MKKYKLTIILTQLFEKEKGEGERDIEWVKIRKESDSTFSSFKITF